MRLLPLLLLTAACAIPAATEPSTEASTKPAAPLAERMAADPTWQPGDTEPVQGEIRTWAPNECPAGATVCAMEVGVTLRNRCGQPAKFLVGPPTETPPADAPINELAAGAAIHAWTTSGYRLYVADADATYSIRAELRHTVVFLGDAACDRLYASRGAEEGMVTRD